MARTQDGDLVPVVHVQWALQTDGEQACPQGRGDPAPPGTPTSWTSWLPLRLRVRFPVLCSDARAPI